MTPRIVVDDEERRIPVQLVENAACLSHLKCCYQDGIKKGLLIGFFIGAVLVTGLYVHFGIISGLR